MRPLALLTRPRPDSEYLAALLRNQSVDSLIEPVIDILPLDGAKLPKLDRIQALLLTSANGVRALAGLLGPPPEARHIPLLAVGTASSGIWRASGGLLAPAPAPGDLFDEYDRGVAGRRRGHDRGSHPERPVSGGNVLLRAVARAEASGELRPSWGDARSQDHGAAHHLEALATDAASVSRDRRGGEVASSVLEVKGAGLLGERGVSTTRPPAWGRRSSGGQLNTASHIESTVSGGCGNTTTADWEHIP